MGSCETLFGGLSSLLYSRAPMPLVAIKAHTRRAEPLNSGLAQLSLVEHALCPLDARVSVFTESPPAGAHVCPAPEQENYCGACRACWDRKVKVVSYRRH